MYYQRQQESGSLAIPPRATLAGATEAPSARVLDVHAALDAMEGNTNSLENQIDALINRLNSVTRQDPAAANGKDDCRCRGSCELSERIRANNERLIGLIELVAKQVDQLEV